MVDRPDSSFQKIEAILEGRSPFPVPKSVACFKPLQGLPIPTQDKMLDHILAGNWNWKNLELVCEDAKALERANKAFCTILGFQWPEEWPTCKTAFPSYVADLKLRWLGPFKALKRSRAKGADNAEREASTIPQAFRVWVESLKSQQKLPALETESVFKTTFNTVNVELRYQSAADMSNFSRKDFTLVICDPPFGPNVNTKNNPVWNDKAWETADFRAVAAQVMVNSSSAGCAIFFKIAFEQYSACREALVREGYLDIEPLTLWDINATDAGGFRHVSACQMLVVGHTKGASQSVWNFGKSPLERQNIKIFKGKKHKSTHPDGRIVNFAEHPEALGVDLIRRYSRPGDAIYVPCAGTGADVIAALAEKRHVVATETDPDQFKFLTERVKSVGTKMDGGQVVRFDQGLINYDNLQRQLRVGVQPVLSTDKLSMRDLMSRYDDQTLEDLTTVWLDVKAQILAERQAAKQAKAAPPQKADAQGGEGGGAEGEGGGKEEAKLVQQAEEEGLDDNLQPLPILGCQMCDLPAADIAPCVVCRKRVCDTCAVPAADNETRICSNACVASLRDKPAPPPAQQTQPAEK